MYRFLIYTFILIVIDLLISLLVNYIRDIPGTMSYVLIVVRSVTILVAYIFLGVIMIKVLGMTNFFAISSIAFIVTYILGCLVFHWIRPIDSSLLRSITDIHQNFSVFSIVFLSYCISWPIAVLILLKLKP